MFSGKLRNLSLFYKLLCSKTIYDCIRLWSFSSCILFQGAHDAEILTLSFTLSTQGNSGEIAKSSYILASGGRDCIIHLYDVERCGYAVF